MAYATKEAQREYNRQSYYKNHEQRREYAKKADQKKRQFRNSLLNQFNCFCCDESDTDLIDWHHVIPEDKCFHVSRFNTADERWWNEVLKCIPVCCNCHRKIHRNKLCLLPQTFHSE